MPDRGQPSLDAEDAFDAAPCGLVVTDAGGSIRLANRTFCQWLGYAAAELVGLVRIQDLLTVGGRIFHQTHWQPLLQMQGSVAEVQLDIRHKAGHVIPMMMNAVRRQHGDVVDHRIAVFITEDRRKYERELIQARKRAEELLLKQQQAQQFGEQMIGIVSHDLRNPLSVIMMGANLLSRGDTTPNQLRTLNRITNSVNRSQRLIADLLDFTASRVGQGLQVSRRAVDLDGLVAESVEDLRLAYPGRTLVHRASGQGNVLVDADRIMQLIGNLVSNAVAYGAPGGSITVESSAPSSGTATISVHNDGIPIPAELMANLFEPMTRGQASSPDARSVGLGLFIVQQIAIAHHGKVTVRSSEHAGTTFVLELPAEPQAPGEASSGVGGAPH